jgi:hypothetical protein
MRGVLEMNSSICPGTTDEEKEEDLEGLETSRNRSSKLTLEKGALGGFQGENPTESETDGDDVIREDHGLRGETPAESVTADDEVIQEARPVGSMTAYEEPIREGSVSFKLNLEHDDAMGLDEEGRDWPMMASDDAIEGRPLLGATGRILEKKLEKLREGGVEESAYKR